jgi:hypothetical protein
MTGVIGALVAFAVVLAIVLALAVRPAVRRLAHTAAAVRADLTVRLDRVAALRRVRPARARAVVVSVVVDPAAGSAPSDTAGSAPSDTLGAAPSGAAPAPSLIGGRGRHRRVDGAP